MSAWVKLPPWTGTKHVGCLTCTDGTPDTLPLDAVIAVGFGYAGLTCDGVEMWRESNDDEDFRRLSEFEAVAALDPEHDWRVIMDGPLRGRTYQRHGVGSWVLVDSNEGFA